jgi:type I restriction enzyme M protein
MAQKQTTTDNGATQGEIQRAIVEADLVDCMVALPGQLFYTTQIPVCLWFLARNKANGHPSTGSGHSYRDRRGETLFIDARQMGDMVDRTHRELSEEDIDKIAATYHAWRGEPEAGEYEDVPGFCKSATLDEIRGHDYVLTPGRYVGIEDIEDDDEPFKEKIEWLVVKLEAQFAGSSRLEVAIRKNHRDSQARATREGCHRHWCGRLSTKPSGLTTLSGKTLLAKISRFKCV